MVMERRGDRRGARCGLWRERRNGEGWRGRGDCRLLFSISMMMMMMILYR